MLIKKNPQNIVADSKTNSEKMWLAKGAIKEIWACS